MTPTPGNASVPGGGPVRVLRSMLSRSLARPLGRKDARAFRAAIVKLDRIGDGVLAVSAVRAVLRHYGETECLLVVTAFVAPLLAAEFPDTPQLVLPIEVGHKRLLWEGRKARQLLRGVSCADVICLRHQRSDWDELVLAWLAGERTHVLDEPRALRESAGRRTFVYAAEQRTLFAEPAAGDAAGCRELERHRQLLSRVLQRPVPTAEVLPRFERVGRGAPRGGVVVTAFGSAAIRDFPVPLLHAALQAASAQGAGLITLLGTAAQQPRLRQLADELRAAGAGEVGCAAPVSVVALAETVAGADLVVTVETATAHLAAAFDRPAVTLIGGGHYGEFGPWRRSPRQVWLTHHLECFGCNWQCIFPEPYCLTQLTAESVREAIATRLSEGATP